MDRIMATIDLSSGKLTFGNAATDNAHDFDLMLIKLTIDQVTGLHNLKEAGSGGLTPTPEFLVDLAAAIDGMGFDGCTPSQAYEIWVIATTAFIGLKKNIARSASLVSGTTATPEPSPLASASVTTPTSKHSNRKQKSTKG